MTRFLNFLQRSNPSDKDLIQCFKIEIYIHIHSSNILYTLEIFETWRHSKA